MLSITLRFYLYALINVVISFRVATFCFQIFIACTKSNQPSFREREKNTKNKARRKIEHNVRFAFDTKESKRLYLNLGRLWGRHLIYELGADPRRRSRSLREVPCNYTLLFENIFYLFYECCVSTLFGLSQLLHTCARSRDPPGSKLGELCVWSC